MIDGEKYIFMVSAESNKPVEMQSVPLTRNEVYLKIACDFRNRTDTARFYYSLNGNDWQEIGGPLKMEYTLMEHFMGYRFGLFTYSTSQTGGYADFDWYRISLVL
jgi:beta-xylosidase